MTADVSKVRRDEWRNQLRAGLPIKMSARLQMALLDALDAAENCIEDFKHDGVKWELRRDRGDLREKLAETEEALRLQKAVNIQLICAQDKQRIKRGSQTMKPNDSKPLPSPPSLRKPTTRRPIDPTLNVMRRASELLLALSPADRVIALRYIAARVETVSAETATRNLTAIGEDVMK